MTKIKFKTTTASSILFSLQQPSCFPESKPWCVRKKYPSILRPGLCTYSELRTANCWSRFAVCGIQRKLLILRSLIFTSSWTCNCLVQNLFSDSFKVIQQNQTAGNTYTSAFTAWVDRECMYRSSKLPVASFSDHLCYSCPNFSWQMHFLGTNWGTSFMCKRKKCHANFWYNCFLSALCAVFGKLFFRFPKKFPIR